MAKVTLKDFAEQYPAALTESVESARMRSGKDEAELMLHSARGVYYVGTQLELPELVVAADKAFVQAAQRLVELGGTGQQVCSISEQLACHKATDAIERAMRRTR